MIKNLIVISSLFFLTGFNNSIDKKYEASISSSEYTEYSYGNDHPGKKLLETNCYACHNPTTSETDRIGPPMIAVKKHYISENTTKEEFTNAMLNWVKEPSEDKSKMPGAVKRFKLMPYQFFPEETIREIADYIYDYEIDQPEWFENHFKKGRGKGMGKGMRNGMGRGMGKRMQQAANSTFTSIEDRGMEIALGTKAELGKNLMGAIQKKGVIHALEFCNVKAITLTDSMATVYNASIKRVTDKPRNPNNKANAIEGVYIENFKKQVAAGSEIDPIIYKQGNETAFYYPIVTNTMCLQCHGSPNKDLEPLTLSKIKDLYPNDKATGYTENQVRGMWSIHFSNN
jgi:cytochrome c553